MVRMSVHFFCSLAIRILQLKNFSTIAEQESLILKNQRFCHIKSGFCPDVLYLCFVVFSQIVKSQAVFILVYDFLQHHLYLAVFHTVQLALKN